MKVIKVLCIFSFIFVFSFFSYGDETNSNLELTIKEELSNIKRKEDKIIFLMNRAKNYAEKKLLKEAIEIYNIILDLEPPYKYRYEILILMGDIYIDMRDYALAIDSYSKAIGLFRKNENAQLRLALAYEKCDLFELARQEYKDMLKRNPNSFEVLFNIAKLELKQGFTSQALEYFRKALVLNPTKKVYKYIAFCAEKLEDYDLAINMLHQTLITEPEYEGYIKIARLYKIKNKIDNAEKALSEAIRLNPEAIEGYIYLSILYIEKNELDYAERLLNIAKEKEPKDALIHFLLSYLYYKQNRLDLSKKEIDNIRSFTKTPLLNFYIEKFYRYIEGIK